ncbi:hypothetical protein [Lutibacter sp.]
MFLENNNIIRNRILYVGILLISLFLFLSNSAQPGIWNAGGSGSFTLLYPEDSIAYKKIQMKSENIYIQLYKGYAVVKGNYNFFNSTKDTIKIKVGYPINNVFPTTNYKSILNQVFFDNLYKIKGSIGNTIIPLFNVPNKNNDNWYVWELEFPPRKELTFTVHFLVNTNNSKVVKGYNNNYRNAFIYLIETGSLWKSPIENGNFYTQLKGGISIKNIKAHAPSNLFFNPNKNILFFKMENYGFTPNDNFIVTYAKKIPDFNFAAITKNSSNLFNEIDDFSNSNLDIGYRKILLENPYQTKGMSNSVIGLIYFVLIFGIPIIIGTVLLIILIIIYKNFKKKKLIKKEK